MSIRFLQGVVCAIVAIAALAWSGQAAAQSCDFVATSSTSLLVPANGSVSASFQGQVACAATITGTITVTADNTGGATVSDGTATATSIPFTATLDTDEVFFINAGPNPGQSGTVTVTCLTGGCQFNPPITFNFTTQNQFDFVANGPTSLVANQITPFTASTNLLLNGGASGLQVNYNNLSSGTDYGNQAPDAAGDSSTTQSIFTSGTYAVRASVQCPMAFVLQGCPPPPVDFTVTIEPVSLTAVTSTAPNLFAGASLGMTVAYGSASIPAADGTNIAWSVASQPTGGDGTVNGMPIAAGESNATFTASVPGTYTVTANSGCTFCSPGLQTFTVTVLGTPTLAIQSGDGQSAQTGTAFTSPLVVTAQNGGLPAGGVAIDWAVVSGSATIVPGGATDFTGGNASATVTATAPGPIQISATRQDAPTATVTFNLTATALPFALVASSPNPASGTVGAPITFTVSLDQGSTPAAGAQVAWAASAPFAPAGTTATTDASGNASASFTPSAAGTFPAAVTATFDPDGIPANGDEISVSFDVGVASVPGLAIASGNGQATPVNTAFAAPLVVVADDSGVPAAGITLLWAVTGDAALVAAGPTDAAGSASATVTAGATPGPVTVTATRADAPGASVSFALAVEALGNLLIVGGDGQTLVGGTPSAPLEVELKDATGLPVAGATISWATSAGTLANATSTTDASGRASNTVTVAVPGAVEVTASSPLAAAPAVFALKGALANLPGLNVLQVEIAKAVDQLCPALAALPAPTPEQQDLLARCIELTVAAGIDPNATVVALDQLMANVALAQGNAAMSALQAQFQNLKARIAALRSGTQGSSFGGLALNTPSGPISLGLLATAFTQANERGTAEIGADFSRWGFFASGTIGRGEADAGAVDPAYDYDINGLTAGADYRINDRWIIGGSLGYTRQDTTLPGERGGLDATGWSVSGYTTFYRADSWYADGVVTWGRNRYELLRRIQYTVPTPTGAATIDQVATADSDGDLLSVAATVGHDFSRGPWSFGPHARLLYTRIGFDPISETLEAGEPGSGLGLLISGRALSSLAGTVGGKLTYVHSAAWGVVIPHLQAEWEHEFKDDPQAIEARFLHDPTGSAMVVRGDPLDTDYFRVGLGLSMVLTKGRSGFVYYEHLLGKDGQSQYNLALGFRMEF